MFFFFSKLLSFVANPSLWIVAILVAALWVKNRPWRKFLAVLGVLMFLLFSNELLFNYASRNWCLLYAQPPNSGHVYDCAIIPGGFGEYHPETRRIQFNEHADRFWYSFYLYKAGIVKKILITGDAAIVKEEDLDPKEDFLRWAETIGIPREDLLLETQARNTFEHTRYIPKLLIKEHYTIENSLLVTSAIHMPRTMATFQKAGLHPVPCSVKLSLPAKIRLTNYAPSVRALYDWNSLLHEWIGLFIYRALGYAE